MRSAFLELGRWLVETGIDPHDVQVTIEFAGKLGRMHAHYRMVDDLRPLSFANNAEEVKKLLRGDTRGTLRGTVRARRSRHVQFRGHSFP